MGCGIGLPQVPQQRVSLGARWQLIGLRANVFGPFGELVFKRCLLFRLTLLCLRPSPTCNVRWRSKWLEGEFPPNLNSGLVLYFVPRPEQFGKSSSGVVSIDRPRNEYNICHISHVGGRTHV
jgi:hypothetical protein